MKKQEVRALKAFFEKQGTPVNSYPALMEIVNNIIMWHTISDTAWHSLPGSFNSYVSCRAEDGSLTFLTEEEYEEQVSRLLATTSMEFWRFLDYGTLMKTGTLSFLGIHYSIEKWHPNIYRGYFKSEMDWLIEMRETLQAALMKLGRTPLKGDTIHIKIS